MTAALFWSASVALVARLVLLARLHLVSDRHPVREAVSDYGVGETSRLFAVMGWVTATAWLLLGAATWTGRPQWSDRPVVAVSFLVIAILAALIPLVPTDLEGERLTVRGAVHYALAVAQFALAYDVAGTVTRLVGGVLIGTLHAVASVSLAGLCLCLVPALRRFFGAAERVFIVTIACLFLVYAVASASGAV